MNRLFTILAALVAALVMTAGPASAHAVVLSSNPEDGAQIAQAPVRVTVTFNEAMQQQFAALTVVGPDNPLALGVVDLFQSRGFRIWGPNKKAAQFESSKVFSQNFMEKYGIPTAKAGTFSDVGSAKDFGRQLDGRCAVKADGLALGKGVLICTSVEESNRAIDEILLQKSFGLAGASIVIQELLEVLITCEQEFGIVFEESRDFDEGTLSTLGSLAALIRSRHAVQASGM